MPKFQKEFPKNARDFFDPASDKEFQKKHPIGYGVLLGCGIVGLVLPMAILTLVIEVWFPAPDSGFILLAMVGCFIIGIGIFNIVAAWIEQYLGHLFTLICFLLGGGLTAISLILMYVLDIYARFDELMVTYYFVSLLFFAVPPVFYWMFRDAIGSWLTRKRLRKCRINELKKGRKNYWWYEAIHAEYDLGMIYWVNKLFTILYLIDLSLSFLFGWVRFMVPVISGLYVVISVLLAGMSMFSSVQDSIEEYGKPVVIFRWSKEGRMNSIILDLVTAVFPILAAYVHICIMLDALGIPR